MSDVLGPNGLPFGEQPAVATPQAAPAVKPIAIRMSGDPELGILNMNFNGEYSITGEPLALLKIFNQCIGAALAFVESLSQPPESDTSNESSDTAPAESEPTNSAPQSPSPPALRLVGGEDSNDSGTDTTSAATPPPPLPEDSNPPAIRTGDDGFSYCCRCDQKLGNCQCGV